MTRRVNTMPKLSATKTAELARFVAFVALHREQTGQRIAQAREHADLTQQEAANEVGVDKRTIQRYEAGDIGKMTTIQRLADVFGLTVEQMLGDQELPPPRSPISERLDRIEEKLDRLLSDRKE